MVCDRCIKAVRSILESNGCDVKEIGLGKAVVTGKPAGAQWDAIRRALEEEGFAFLDDKRHRLVETIKNAIVEMVHYKDLSAWKGNFSDYISAQLHKDYNYLSHLFSESENTTIEQYIIQQKIEKVKEWLVYDELTLSEIADRLGYSSVAHLSNQFKKVTGFSPSRFKKLKEHKRISLDKI